MKTSFKKVWSLVICLLIVSSFSVGCSKDKTQNEQTGASSQSDGASVDDIKDDEDSQSALVGSWKSVTMSDAIYTFNADGTGEYEFYGNKSPFTYTDNGDSVEIKYETDTVASVFKYIVEDNELNIEDSFGEMYTYKKK